MRPIGDYITIEQLDNGWVIDVNKYSDQKEMRLPCKRMIARDTAEVVETIQSIITEYNNK